MLDQAVCKMSISNACRVPEDAAQEVIQRLQSAGYSCACVIGNVLETGTAGHQNKPEVGIKCHELNDITLVGSGL